MRAFCILIQLAGFSNQRNSTLFLDTLFLPQDWVLQVNSSNDPAKQQIAGAYVLCSSIACWLTKSCWDLIVSACLEWQFKTKHFEDINHELLHYHAMMFKGADCIVRIPARDLLNILNENMQLKWCRPSKNPSSAQSRFSRPSINKLSKDTVRIC